MPDRQISLGLLPVVGGSWGRSPPDRNTHILETLSMLHLLNCWWTVAPSILFQRSPKKTLGKVTSLHLHIIKCLNWN